MNLARLARLRVPLGFLCGIFVLLIAQPTTTTLALGAAVAACGEALRIWAAGHLNKAREVTAAGPYRWMAHPLYVGSSIMGAGLALACGSVVVAVLIAVYLGVTLTAAIRTEEAVLRNRFGSEYDQYRRARRENGSAAPRVHRAFSVRQAITNGEHRTVVGVTLVLLLLFLKATYNVVFWQPGG